MPALMLHDAQRADIDNDPGLTRTVEEAAARFTAALVAELPGAGPELLRWLDSLSAGAGIAAYYTHPVAFPMLRFARWLDEALDGAVGEALQLEIAESTIAGYAFIRMIDDVMDRSPRARPDLLPALAWFHARFEAPYRQRFAAADPFWAGYRDIWSGTADAAVCDGLLADLDEERFLRVAAAKVSAGRLPLLAVSRAHGLDEIPADWDRVLALMGAWHQMYNDTFDWVDDLARGAQTYVLCEARRRAGAAVELWMIGEGVLWAAGRMDGWMADMRVLAARLAAPRLGAYLAARDAQLSAIVEAIRPGLTALSAVTAAASAP